MKYKIFVFTIAMLYCTGTYAQTVLQSYIDSALLHNIVLQRKNIQLDQAAYALEMARGMFYPTVELQGQYTTATGGRNIELPVGDLLNDVYSTLNDLTASDNFRPLQNQSFNLLPLNFYDAKIHTTVPVYDAKLVYNKRIQEQKVAMSREEITIYQRDLVEKVKTAYVNYLQTLDVIHIYQSALELAREAMRVNQKLLDQGKGLPAYLIRSESEVTDAEAQIADARQKADNARRYFNFLLNREADAAIETPEEVEDPADQVILALAQIPDISAREEMDLLDKAIELQENVHQLDQAAQFPSLYGFLDLGSQAENWKFDNQSRYLMVGLQLNIPIFSGYRHRNKQAQSELGIQDALRHREFVEKQLTLNGQVARNDLESAYLTYRSSEKQLESAATYQRLIEKGYRAGANTYLETVDARNQLTNARLSLSIHRLEMLAALAKLERATASYILK